MSGEMVDPNIDAVDPMERDDDETQPPKQERDPDTVLGGEMKRSDTHKKTGLRNLKDRGYYPIFGTVTREEYEKGLRPPGYKE